MVFKRLSERMSPRRFSKSAMNTKPRLMNKQVASSPITSTTKFVAKSPTKTNTTKPFASPPRTSIRPLPPMSPNVRRASSPRRLMRSPLPKSRPGVPPPPMPTPPPIPSGVHPPCPTAFARLPHACISLSYRVPIRPARKLCRDDSPRCSEDRLEDDDDEFKQASVSFRPDAQVMEIPSHIHYTQEVRNTLWQDEKERLRNTRRNKIEFFYEREDMNNVLEEESFIGFKGRLLHPVTHKLLMNAIVRGKEKRRRAEAATSSPAKSPKSRRIRRRR